jgi:hypothetical protein
MERKAGFYWVKWGGEWTIAEWGPDVEWMPIGLDYWIGDEDLDAIGLEIVKPEGLE